MNSSLILLFFFVLQMCVGMYCLQRLFAVRYVASVACFYVEIHCFHRNIFAYIILYFRLSVFLPH